MLIPGCKKLIFATQNPNKVKEIKLKLGEGISIISLIDLDYVQEIEEHGNTLEENALIKARHVYNLYGENCFSEDTGLEVFALRNAPGVHTARYAGEEKSAEANMDLLLKNLDNHEDRTAQFRAVIALIFNGKEYLFEGISRGQISITKRGNKGFGYDSIFIPEGYKQTFAELDQVEKAALSHRSRAFEQLVGFIKENCKDLSNH